MTNRPGVALLLALIVMLLVEAMAACMLALATQNRLIGSSDVRSVRADVTARYAVRTAALAAARQRLDTITPGVERPLASGRDADASWAVTAERLRSGMLVLRARARVGGPSAFSEARAASVARFLDAPAILQQLNAAVASGGAVVVAGASDVSASAATLPPAWPDSVCPAVAPLPIPGAITAAATPLVSATANVSGSVSVDTMLAVPDSAVLAGLSWRDLAGLADRHESGTVLLMAAVDSAGCDTSAPGNWGDPSQPLSPCGLYFPLVHSSGDLRIDGGAGQGILVVDGALTLGAGASFTGIVLARDGVSLEPGSSIYGAVHSLGTTLIDDGTAAYSGCALARVLAGSPAAGRLVLRLRAYLPGF